MRLDVLKWLCEMFKLFMALYTIFHGYAIGRIAIGGLYKIKATLTHTLESKANRN